MTDPISDMLTRIRNAHRALLPVVEVPHSKMKESIAALPIPEEDKDEIRSGNAARILRL